MAWEQPIFDRTNEDVEFAFANQSSVLNLKGALNVSDLSRIDNNTIYLRDLLLSYGYETDVDVRTTWLETDFPTLAEIDRIRSNCIKLMAEYFHYSTTPTPITGKEFLKYTDINDIEKVISDINNILQSMIDSLLLCGSRVKCGAFNLPNNYSKGFYSLLEEYSHYYLERFTNRQLENGEFNV